jgi:hypothetical protein
MKGIYQYILRYEHTTNQFQKIFRPNINSSI